MANIAKISGYIAKTAVAEVKNELIMGNLIDSKTYKSEFDSKVNGYKVGDVISLKKDALFNVVDGFKDGTDISGKYNEVDEELITGQVNSNPIVPTTITDRDATFALSKPSNEKEWKERVIKGVARRLASKSEQDLVEVYTASADNVIAIEDVSTIVLKDQFKAMNARLAATRAPSDNRKAIVNTEISNILSGEVEEYFNPNKAIGTAFAEARMGKYGGLDFYCSEIANPVRVNGCGGVTLTLANDYVGGSSQLILTDASTVVVGDKIEFAFNIVDQESKSLTTKKAQRAIKSVVGNVVTIAPLYFEGATNQNVDATELLTGATVTGVGVSGETYLVVPVFQKMGFASASIKQPALGALDKINATVDMGGVSLRIFTGDDVDTATSKQRAETLNAYFAPRSEWCGVIEINIASL